MQGRMTLNHNALEHQQNHPFASLALHPRMRLRVTDNQDFQKPQSKDSTRLLMLLLVLDPNQLLNLLLRV